MEYENFEVEDFLLDESFQNWVNGAGNNKFWENWITQHPQKAGIIEQARALLLHTAFYEKPVESTEVESELTFLTERIRQNLKKESKLFWSIRTWQRIAASLLLLLVAMIGWYSYYHLRTSNYHTAYAETKKIILPDGSKVILNSNSEIEFKADLSSDKERIIYLKGEAFFEVTHTKNHQKFIVTTNGINVTVLGTKFNVNGRRGNVKVVLNSGKVKVTDTQNRSLLMAPGEMVEFNPVENKYLKSKVSTELYTSWKHNRLEFKNTPIKEIFQLLEDNYGFEVVVNNISLRDRRLTGNFPADSISILLESMGEVFDLEITQNKKQIIVGNNNK
jgi:transmembrane sensor